MEESRSFTVVAPYYDLLMRDVPYRAWVRYLHQLLGHRGMRARRVLELACGTGTVAEMLAREGFDVAGVDLSEAMIAAARRKAAERALAIRYYVQDAAEMRVPEGPFDLCVSLFDSLNYITVPARLEASIRRVYEHLRPGGLFIFDVNSAFALKNGFFDQENLNSSDRLRYVWRSEYDSETSLCRVHMRFFWRNAEGVDEEFREEHVQYAYLEEELLDMLEDTGFSNVEAFHAYSFLPVRNTTDRIFFAASRPETPVTGA